MKRRRRNFIVAISVVLGLALGSAGAYVVFDFARELWLQAAMLEQIEARYGFTLTGPYVMDGTTMREQWVIDDVQPGSAFDGAGVTSGEILVDFSRGSRFLQHLDRPAGEVIVFETVPDSGMPRIDHRRRTRYEVVAP